MKDDLGVPYPPFPLPWQNGVYCSPGAPDPHEPRKQRSKDDIGAFSQGQREKRAKEWGLRCLWATIRGHCFWRRSCRGAWTRRLPASGRENWVWTMRTGHRRSGRWAWCIRTQRVVVCACALPGVPEKQPVPRERVACAAMHSSCYLLCAGALLSSCAVHWVCAGTHW